MSTKLRAHPYADFFPMMTASELDALAADIKENGLRQPIIVYQKEILDGRNRLKACEMAKVEPTFTEYEGDDPLGLVISLNIQRRDLTAAQRAIVAARTLIHFPERRGRPKKCALTGHNTRSREDVATEFKVGKNQVQQARAIIEEAPALAAQVEACAISLADAYRQVQERVERAKQEKAEADRRTRDAEQNTQYRDAVSNGEMTLDNALQQVRDEERAEKQRAEESAQARQLWLKRLEEVVAWVETSIGTRTDDHLAWYSEPGAPGTQTAVTDERLAGVIAQISRVRKATFGG